VAQRRELVGIPGVPLSPRDRSQGCAFAARCEYSQDACRDQAPPSRAVEDEHVVRCHRSEFVQRQAVLAPTAARPSAWQERIADDEAMLSVSGISAFYGSTRVLHDVDLKVRKGTCLALVGESGSGKTTLARSLSGLHAGTVTGELSFDGPPRQAKWARFVRVGAPVRVRVPLRTRREQRGDCDLGLGGDRKCGWQRGDGG
jgi:peptide/nickel transport system ATP-binding protein